MIASSTLHSRIRWDYINLPRTARHILNGIFTRIFSRRFYAQRLSENSWLDLNCWALRNATLLRKSQPNDCATLLLVKDLARCVPFLVQWQSPEQEKPDRALRKLAED